MSLRPVTSTQLAQPTMEGFANNDMVIVRYEGPSGAPGMPEMLDSTSRITVSYTHLTLPTKA